MKRILVTGSTGFVGRNILPLLEKEYIVESPNRKELDLRDKEKIIRCIKKGNYDVIIHAAIPNVSFNEKDREESMIVNTLRPFDIMYELQDYYEKMIYFGSGAEYDKTKSIILANEADIGVNIPATEYGFAKYIMNSLARKSENVYNLRIFGCYGKTDASFKLITYAIQCCLFDKEIKLKQDCYFDYMQVMDIFPVLKYFIGNTPQFHDYNICTGRRIRISEICKMVINMMGSRSQILIEKRGMNNEYSGDNTRLLNEIKEFQFMTLEEGIKQQIEYERERLYI